MLDATCVLQVCPLLMAKYISKSRLYVANFCFVFIVFIGGFVLNTIHVKALYAIEAVLACGACWLVVERCMIFRVLSCLLLGWFRLERILWHCCCHLERLLVIVKVYDNVSFTCLVFAQAPNIVWLAVALITLVNEIWNFTTFDGIISYRVTCLSLVDRSMSTTMHFCLQ